MPLYDYLCTYCGEVITKLAKERDPHPYCRCGCVTTRPISTSNFHLKGSGWYKTDFSGKKNSEG